MLKNLFIITTIFASLGAISPVHAQKAKASTTSSKAEVKFLENISVEVQPAEAKSDPKAVFAEPRFIDRKTPVPSVSTVSAIENASELQIKYAQLLDLDVEDVSNINMFKVIDEWFGTRYRLGGSNKDGIDCSALMQTFYTSIYGLTIPRTAHEQYTFSKKISRTEIRAGDLVFFNTIGGVSHVGMYLQNNKFVHASKNGVTISDLYEDYWLKHFVGAGRIQETEATALNLNP